MPKRKNTIPDEADSPGPSSRRLRMDKHPSTLISLISKIRNRRHLFSPIDPFDSSSDQENGEFETLDEENGPGMSTTEQNDSNSQPNRTLATTSSSNQDPIQIPDSSVEIKEEISIHDRETPPLIREPWFQERLTRSPENDSSSIDQVQGEDIQTAEPNDPPSEEHDNRPAESPERENQTADLAPAPASVPGPSAPTNQDNLPTLPLPNVFTPDYAEFLNTVLSSPSASAYYISSRSNCRRLQTENNRQEEQPQEPKKYSNYREMFYGSYDEISASLPCMFLDLPLELVPFDPQPQKCHMFLFQKKLKSELFVTAQLMRRASGFYVLAIISPFPMPYPLPSQRHEHTRNN